MCMPKLLQSSLTNLPTLPVSRALGRDIFPWTLLNCLESFLAAGARFSEARAVGPDSHLATGAWPGLLIIWSSGPSIDPRCHPFTNLLRFTHDSEGFLAAGAILPMEHERSAIGLCAALLLDAWLGEFFSGPMCPSSTSLLLWCRCCDSPRV